MLGIISIQVIDALSSDTYRETTQLIFITLNLELWGHFVTEVKLN